MFFKKKTNPVSELFKDYSNPEKTTILSLLLLSALCDNQKIAKEEMDYLNTYVDILNVSSKEVNKYIGITPPELLFTSFSNMDKYKIENALFLILGMLSADGKPNEKEVNFLSGLLERVNISQEAFLEDVQKTKALYDYFK